MRKRLIPLLMALSLLSGCGNSSSPQHQDDTLTILATTYPVYLYASAVTDGLENIRVERLNTGNVSCLHDYTLSVNDMKKIEQADVIAMSGVGLEEFMDDALNTSDALVIDCSQGVALLENLSHHHNEGDDHDHDHGHFDPHYWLNPENAAIAVNNLAQGLAAALPELRDTLTNNASTTTTLLEGWNSALEKLLWIEGEEQGTLVSIPGLITFHDGFQYLAHAYSIPLLESIEEEAGSEASAQEIVEITALVKQKDIPVIFTEINGSDATANAIARETGCKVAQLSTIMDGPDSQLSNYFDAMMGNMTAIVNGFAGEEIIH